MSDPVIRACLGRDREPLVTVELEHEGDLPRYVAFDRTGLRRYADVLKRCLELLRVRPGDLLAYFDYGTSPLVYLSSSSYMPYLRTGAAEALGCTTICNDGVPTMSERATDIVRYVRPRFLFVRADCLRPFTTACGERGVRLSDHTEAVVATHNDGRMPYGILELCRDRLGVPLYEMPRCDRALFLALECPECRCVHVSPDVYEALVVDAGSEAAVPSGESGWLRVMSRSLPGGQPSVVTRLRARLIEGSCSRAPGDLRFALSRK